MEALQQDFSNQEAPRNTFSAKVRACNQPCFGTFSMFHIFVAELKQYSVRDLIFFPLFKLQRDFSNQEA